MTDELKRNLESNKELGRLDAAIAALDSVTDSHIAEIISADCGSNVIVEAKTATTTLLNLRRRVITSLVDRHVKYGRTS